MRKSGILLPIFSLPSAYGIGTLGKSAYKFIDFLHLAHQSYWQVLPLGPTSYGDSPYQTFSAFAGNPYFIDLDMLVEDGLLYVDELIDLNSSAYIDYGMQYEKRYPILRLAYSRFIESPEYTKFVKQEKAWLDDYAIFMALKNCHNGESWLNWKNEYKHYNKRKLNAYYKEHKESVDFYKFLQFEFFKQWNALKEYANSLDIKIIGDVPIYVALDSADVWSNPEMFDLDLDLKPVKVAGCPPDDFAKTGQLWGNPLYNWKKLEEDNFDWWIKRLRKSFELYDTVRIDHFRGFEAYYSIPACDETAENGKWVKGPGMKLFNEVKKQLPNASIIAEDLGFLTEGVYKLLKRTGFPGMKILEFAFDLENDSNYLVHNHIKNSVVYTGTHDNLPLRAWFNEQDEEHKHFIMEYLMLQDESKVCDQMVRLALMSPSDLAIIPIQDYLGLGIESRINTPSVPMNNWVWRLDDEYITDELASYIAFLTKTYKREN